MIYRHMTMIVNILKKYRSKSRQSLTYREEVVRIMLIIRILTRILCFECMLVPNNVLFLL